MVGIDPKENKDNAFFFFFWGGGCGEGGGGLLHHKIYLTLLHLNISKHFLYTVHYTFPKVKENLLNNPNLL